MVVQCEDTQRFEIIRAEYLSITLYLITHISTQIPSHNYLRVRLHGQRRNRGRALGRQLCGSGQQLLRRGERVARSGELRRAIVECGTESGLDLRGGNRQKRRRKRRGRRAGNMKKKPRQKTQMVTRKNDLSSTSTSRKT